MIEDINLPIRTNNPYGIIIDLTRRAIKTNLHSLEYKIAKQIWNKDAFGFEIENPMYMEAAKLTIEMIKDKNKALLNIRHNAPFIREISARIIKEYTDGTY